MSINFQSLPGERPGFAIPPEGVNYAKVAKAEVRTPKNGGKDYLSLIFDVTANINGEMKTFKLFDRLFQSTNQWPLFKLSRLIHALNIDPKAINSFDDIALIAPGRAMYLNIIHQKNDRTGAPEAVVALFDSDCYYRLDEVEMDDTLEVSDEDLPFTIEPVEDTIIEEEDDDEFV